MTKPVYDYFARCMEDPEFAAAYQELEAEHQTERARIQAQIQRRSLWQALDRRLGLSRALDWFRKTWQHLSGQPSPPAASPQQ